MPRVAFVPALRIAALSILVATSAAACGNTADGGPSFSAAASNVTSLQDTVPSHDGSTFYYIANGSDGKPAVFTVPAAGGKATSLAAGAPLSNPVGIAISGDDKTLFIADPVVGILTLPASGGTPSVLSGTASSYPRGVEVAAPKGTDVVYFTGGAGATTGVFTIPPAGGDVTTIAQGSPFEQPTGIAVAKDGTVYVSNPSSFAPGSSGGILKVSGGSASSVVGDLPLGFPAGVALTADETTLLVSGIDSSGSHAAVYAVDLATGDVTSYSQGITDMKGAGGLHASGNGEIFSWAGVCGGNSATCSGTVFKVTF